jgi:Immunoglobulin domain/Immunoglobulin I-set domain
VFDRDKLHKTRWPAVAKRLCHSRRRTHDTLKEFSMAISPPQTFGPRRHWQRALATLAVCLAAGLSACSSGSDADPEPVVVVNPPAAIDVGTVTGSVLRSDTSAPIAGAKVSAGGASTQSGADGSFTLPGVAVAARATIKVEAPGFMDGFVVGSSTANTTSAASAARLVPAGAAVTFDAGSAATVTSPGSSAQVILPASGLVVESTGAAVSGNATARITPINPANDPQSMPGDYTASDNSTIESFGAINVTLLDASGNKLNLKSGSQATIRIPLASRTADAPATMPLYHFNETTGFWVQEGSATLQGTAPNQYYEGTVTHFSTWNVDRPLDTVFMNGCVNNADGTPAANVSMTSSGVDYSGVGRRSSDAAGRFNLPLRRNGVASVLGEIGVFRSNTVVVGPSATDFTVNTCLVLSSTPVAPVLIVQPQSNTVDEGQFAFLYVTANGPGSLTYQWQLNGVNLEGATYPYLWLGYAAAANAGTYTCVVTNSVGSVTSTSAALTVRPVAPRTPTIVSTPAATSSIVGGTATFNVAVSGTAPLAYQWQRNGVDIGGATGASYTTGALALADSGAIYRVRVSNVAGSVLSTPVTLTVTAASTAVAPTITVQAANSTVIAGQTASFGVTAIGTPTPTYQWFRNGTAITGATGSSYTTGALTVNDSGSTYRVVVTNSQGSVTSSDAAVTVTPATVVGGTTEKLNLLRLLTLSFNLYEAGGFPDYYIADNETTFRGPGNVCSTGTASGTFNGGAIPAAGTVVPARGTLAATANACVLDQQTYTGSSTIGYEVTSFNPPNGNALYNINNMRVRTNGNVLEDYTANGSAASVLRSSVAGNLETTDITLTPDLNATIRSEITGLTSVFTGGNIGFVVVERTDATAGTIPTASIRVSYNQLAFTVGGQSYNADGFYEAIFNPNGGLTSGSGQVLLTTGGVRIGRIYATAEGVFVEADGSVQAFKGNHGERLIGK